MFIDSFVSLGPPGLMGPPGLPGEYSEMILLLIESLKFFHSISGF